jgi:hypothetical protein
MVIKNYRGVPYNVNSKEMVSHSGFELWVEPLASDLYHFNCESLEKHELVEMKKKNATQELLIRSPT